MIHLYRHFDANNTLLYVGISVSTIQRLNQHKDTSTWFSKIARVTIETFKTREEALMAEKQAIQEEKPIFNKVHNGFIPRGNYTNLNLTLNKNCVLYLVSNCHKYSLVIANLLLILGTRTRKSDCLKISLAILCEASKLSKPTVIAALDSLCEQHFIARAGHQTYKIEPSLAWFGNQTDWAIALKEHSEKYGRNFGYGETLA